MRVSLCTVCKNRAIHYKQTILKNIQDNIANEDVEFILLDYNSEDDLEIWVKENLIQHIKSGLLTYYKTFEPKYFQRSHSRNMVFRLATGDLICNVDADNFTGTTFSTYLSEQYDLNKNIFVCVGGRFDFISRPDIGGRLCVSRQDFLLTSGYDEDMNNYGYEDFDLINRLELLSRQKILITNEAYLNVIEHDNINRIKEEFPYKNIKIILIHYISPSTSKVLFLFLNNSYELATFTSEKNFNSAKEPPNLFYDKLVNGLPTIEGDWIKGIFEENKPGSFTFFSKGSDNLRHKLEHVYDGDYYRLKNEIETLDFYAIKDPPSIEEIILFYSRTDNRTKMLNNFNQKLIKPNKAAIGSGIVYKNFDYETAIIL